ncbi:uncharacterized protein LOC124195521 [Daphnia pulex]|uniref:uncharacterized protein LOC124195521 n=1 Tax=Daphnia pulex TaxID=6669 RepID=UPI001EDDBDE8|nr:uncharacterized protein LOC124195521 [Daphnia pulex]
MKKTLCECSLQKRTKMISIFYLLVNLATGFYRSYQLGLIEFVGEYDGVKAFSCISNTLVAFILAMFSALLIYAVYNNHRQLMMPWLFTTILIACTRDVYMLIRSFFYASAGTWLGVLYVTAMVMQITLGMYLWWVVYGFYHELKDKENEKRKKDLLVGNSSTNPATSDPV